ncbi:uncharacterized protein LOC116201259 [Punica granatum]|uniref:Late embryogenesis abundant protein LEA-2 subgroup domain-containing protein n=2 Tax=Punica granatum TaxID=22663 RepID=A0A218WN11_PUNGR|nr:uncharacterized protein LOC116201259 [Punica granatum]OWM73621.1 hypothetical protein CDL15_Pgr026720 [Punica granatum]PKI47076.1 hypothetical protein CRG98_032552 [Punica granatum]
MESSNNNIDPIRPPVPRPRRGPPTRARRVVSCLTLSAVMLFILCSAVGLVTWLFLRPRLPAFRVQSFSISGFNLSAAQIAGKYHLELGVTNLNPKIDLSFDHFSSSVVYRGVSLHLQILGNQEAELELEMDTGRLKDKARKRIVGNLIGEWSKGVVILDVKMTVWANFRAVRWLTKQKVLTVACKNLNVEFVSDTWKLQEGRNNALYSRFRLV